MQAFPRRYVAILLLAVLATLVVARGVVPAMSAVGSDFPSYLTAARIVADRGSVERLYDIPWFQEQMRRYRIGEPSAGKFSPFPPPTALLLLPIANLEPLDALRVLTAVSVVCLVGAIALLSRILVWTLVDAAVLVLLSAPAILTTLRLGQPYILVSASCIAGYYACLRNRPWLAGACFGLFIPIKYFPLIYVAWFALRRCWQVVAGAGAVIAVVSLASVWILGWKLHAQFLGAVLGSHLVARLGMQDPFAVSFQSFDTLFRQLFVLDATANPHPLVIAPWLHGAGVLFMKTTIAAATIATLVRLGRSRGAAEATAPALGLLGIGTLLLAPATASYHLVLLWLPVALLVDFFLREGAAACAGFLVGGYTLIGFFPYPITAQFAGRGALTLLAYPRLFLLLAMFLACVRCLWRSAAAAGMPVAADLRCVTSDDAS
jgi:hypothetical protein